MGRPFCVARNLDWCTSQDYNLKSTHQLFHPLGKLKAKLPRFFFTLCCCLFATCSYIFIISLRLFQKLFRQFGVVLTASTPLGSVLPPLDRSQKVGRLLTSSSVGQDLWDAQHPQWNFHHADVSEEAFRSRLYFCHLVMVAMACNGQVQPWWLNRFPLILDTSLATMVDVGKFHIIGTISGMFNIRVMDYYLFFFLMGIPWILNPMEIPGCRKMLDIAMRESMAMMKVYCHLMGVSEAMSPRHPFMIFMAMWKWPSSNSKILIRQHQWQEYHSFSIFQMLADPVSRLVFIASRLNLRIATALKTLSLDEVGKGNIIV